MDRIDYYDWIDSRHVPAWRLSIVTEEYNSAYDSDYVFYKNNFAIDYEGLGDFLSEVGLKYAIYEKEKYALFCCYLLRGLL